MKICTTTDGECRLIRAYDSTQNDTLPIRHFLTLLICRVPQAKGAGAGAGVPVEDVYKRLCKERLVQFSHQQFVSDIKLLQRAGYLEVK